jgi:hypothetical protein
VRSFAAAFKFPDPRTWPADAVGNFRLVTEPRFLMDMFAFRHSDQTGSFYMEDAVSCLQLLPIRRDEWSTELGYPSFTFEWGKLSGYTQKLQAAGYCVLIMEKAAQGNLKKSGKVVSISTARNSHGQRRHKWA